MSKPFDFDIGDQVVITISGERGWIQGRAEYQMPPHSYLVLYKAADGTATESWWREDQLSKAA